MKHYEIHPFYYPTTVLFVDDNPRFLSNLSLQLDPSLACLRFDSPVAAQGRVNGAGRTAPLIQKYFSRCHEAEFMPLSHHVIDLDLDKIHREVHNEYRFEEISVVVVDFAMPGMDGLEFCRGIRNPAIKKILLTGKADEKVAVRAFNRGIIDRFIMKSDSEAIPILNQAIFELQQAYFQQVEQMLANALAVGSHAYLRDSQFGDLFNRICSERGIVEFYLSSNPDGFLMLDSDARAYLLLIQSEHDLQSHYQVAFDQVAPPPLLEALKTGAQLPYFWETDGYFRSGLVDWERFMFPSQEFRGQHSYYFYSMIEQPASFVLPGLTSFNDYLARLDDAERSAGGLQHATTLWGPDDNSSPLSLVKNTQL